MTEQVGIPEFVLRHVGLLTLQLIAAERQILELKEAEIAKENGKVPEPELSQ